MIMIMIVMVIIDDHEISEIDDHFRDRETLPECGERLLESLRMVPVQYISRAAALSVTVACFSDWLATHAAARSRCVRVV